MKRLVILLLVFLTVIFNGIAFNVFQPVEHSHGDEEVSVHENQEEPEKKDDHKDEETVVTNEHDKEKPVNKKKSHGH